VGSARQANKLLDSAANWQLSLAEHGVERASFAGITARTRTAKP